MSDEGTSTGSCWVGRRDVSALIGLCAVLEGHLAGDPDRYVDLRRHLGRRMATDGVAPGVWMSELSAGR